MADKRILTDKQSMDELVELMPQHERTEYHSYKWRALESAFAGRKMVVYTMKNGRPTNIELVSFGELAVGVKEAPTVKITYKRREQIITPVPVRLADRDVFLSIPQNFEFRWAGQEINGALEFRAHYAMLMKTRSRDALAIEGHTYCLTLKRFHEAYPKLADEVRL